jgi:hypothetical protein
MSIRVKTTNDGGIIMKLGEFISETHPVRNLTTEAVIARLRKELEDAQAKAQRVSGLPNARQMRLHALSLRIQINQLTGNF